MNDNDYDELLSQLATASAESNRSKVLHLTKRRAAVVQKIEDEFGTESSNVLKSSESALRYLSCPILQKRIAALLGLIYLWPCTSTVCEQVIMLVNGDEDLELRKVALLGLGNWYENTQNVEIGRILAKLSNDENEPKSLRDAALYTLKKIAGISSIADSIE